MKVTEILYSDYAEREARNERTIAAFSMMEQLLPHKEYCEIEQEMNAGADAETQAAFCAGFEAAIKMIMEAAK